MALYRDQGVVLRTIRLGEADRIVTLATSGRGKVRAVVKGVRKTTSRWGSRMEPMSHVSVICWQGRDLDTVTQAHVLDHFRVVRSDLDRLSRARVVLEVVDQVFQEGQANPRLYSMLVGALRTMDSADSPLVMSGFLWKLLALEGSAPVLDACARCSTPASELRPVGLVAFDLVEGGALCRSCRRGMPVSGEALAVIGRILGGDLAGVLRELASPSPITTEVDHLAAFALEQHLERRIRSLHALDH
ncbi:MAG: DNA repair protein RecO [Acidimicrobiales bacterium]